MHVIFFRALWPGGHFIIFNITNLYFFAEGDARQCIENRYTSRQWGPIAQLVRAIGS